MALPAASVFPGIYNNPKNQTYIHTTDGKVYEWWDPKDFPNGQGRAHWVEVGNLESKEENNQRILSKEGDSGPNVRTIQQFLIARGYLGEGEDDAKFGPRTAAAVRAYQKDEGLKIDGVVGPKTWQSISHYRGFPEPKKGQKEVTQYEGKMPGGMEPGESNKVPAPGDSGQAPVASSGNADAIAYYAYRAGFRGEDLIKAVAIALAESGGNPGASGDESLEDNTWGASLGLWQVRSLHDQTGTGNIRDGSKLKDPDFNAHSAYILYSQQGFKPWSTYIYGQYKGFLSQASSAVSRVTGGNLANIGLEDMSQQQPDNPETNPDQVRQIFQNFVGRDPTDMEISRWSGKNPDDVNKELGNTQESQGYRAASAGLSLLNYMQETG